MPARLAVATVVGIVLGSATGCTRSIGGTGTPAPTSATGTGSGTAAPTTAGDQAAAVRRVVLNAADLPAGQRVQLLDGGDQVTGQVTMDLCGFRFASEANRVARRQVVVVGPDDQTPASNEVVAYDTPAHAAQALNEWRHAARTCPRTWRTDPVADAPPARWTVTLRTAPTLPVPDNAYTAAEVTLRDTTWHYYLLAILQRHTAVLDAVYYQATTPPGTAATRELIRLATITGTRLTTLN